MSQKAFVVVGGGQAGCRAAEALRSHLPDRRIVLIGAEPHLPYERPPLSKGVISGTVAPGALTIRDKSFFDAARIELRLGTPVAEFDPGRKLLWLANGETLDYERLLLTTGSKARTLAVGGSHLPGIHYLRTVDDALRLHANLSACRQLIVVGAGFIGLELAAVGRTHFGCAVTVVEAGPDILQRGVPPEMRRAIHDLHRAHGVRFELATTVEGFQGEGRVERVICSSGAVLAADCVIVGIGVVPEVKLAQTAGLAVQDGIVVNEYCETSTREVYAAGEVTSHWNRQLSMFTRLESWQTAQNQPLSAAGNMAGHQVAYDQVPWFWTDQYGINIQLLGVIDTSETTITRTYERGAKFVTFYVERNRVVGAFGFNCGKDVQVTKKCLESDISLPVDSLGDAAVDLRKLAKRSA